MQLLHDHSGSFKEEEIFIREEKGEIQISYFDIQRYPEKEQGTLSLAYYELI